MKKLILLMGCLTMAGAAQGAIAVDTTTTSGNQNTNNVLAWPTTFGATDTCAVLSCTGSGVTFSSAAINQTSFFTLQPNISTDATDGWHNYQATFPNPPSGAKTVTASFSAANVNANCMLIAFTGSSPCTVDVSSTIASLAGSTIMGSTVTTTVANDYLVDQYLATGGALTAGIGQTLIFSVVNNNQSDGTGSSYKPTTTAGSYFSTWNSGGNPRQAMSVLAIEPASTVVAPAAGTCIFQ